MAWDRAGSYLLKTFFYCFFLSMLLTLYLCSVGNISKAQEVECVRRETVHRDARGVEGRVGDMADKHQFLLVICLTLRKGGEGEGGMCEGRGWYAG